MLRQILTVGLLGLLAALVVGSVAIWNVTRIREADAQLATLQRLGEQVQTIRFGNADTNGWQGFYAWDTRMSGPVEAVQGGKDTNREGFEKAAESTTAAFGAADVSAMTPDEKRLFTTMRTNWDAYLAGDAEAVAAFRTGTEAGLEKGTTIINEGVCVETYDAIDTAGQQLAASVGARVAAQRQTVADRAHDTVVAIVVTLVLFAALALAVAVRVATRLIRRIRAAQQSIEALGAGDLTVPCEAGSADEIDAISGAIERARLSMRDVIAAVQDASTRVGDSSADLAGVAQRLGTSSGATRRRLEQIADSTTEVTHSVDTVATATEEMSASIRAIADNAHHAAQVAGNAVGVAARTNATVGKLGSSSAEIGDVIAAIGQIAGQTNLLALNATIESARAGEAGKGFAVVANEVKELAQETSAATEDITRRIGAIQAGTEAAVAALSEIGEVIATIDDTQRTIAAAVEEQNATTNEMGANASAAAQRTTTIGDQVASAELSARAADLQDVVRRFVL